MAHENGHQREEEVARLALREYQAVLELLESQDRLESIEGINISSPLSETLRYIGLTIEGKSYSFSVNDQNQLSGPNDGASPALRVQKGSELSYYFLKDGEFQTPRHLNHNVGYSTEYPVETEIRGRAEGGHMQQLQAKMYHEDEREVQELFLFYDNGELAQYQKNELNQGKEDPSKLVVETYDRDGSLISHQIGYESQHHFQTLEYTLPTWAVSALEYGLGDDPKSDYNLDDDDIAALKAFQESLPGQGHFSWGQKDDFAHDNDLDGIAGEVIQATWNYREVEKDQSVEIEDEQPSLQR
jgi:hypothetical protein